MTKTFKMLLALEAVVCFGPVAFFLPIGVLMLPMQIAELFRHPEHWQDHLSLVGLVICGVAGMTALCFVVAKLWDNSRIERPLLVLAGTAMGVAGLVGYTNGISDDSVWVVLGALPLLATAHILFLARNLLCHSGLGSGSEA
jgi:hypothetical protein